MYISITYIELNLILRCWCAYRPPNNEFYNGAKRNGAAMVMELERIDLLKQVFTTEKDKKAT